MGRNEEQDTGLSLVALKQPALDVDAQVLHLKAGYYPALPAF